MQKQFDGNRETKSQVALRRNAVPAVGAHHGTIRRLSAWLPFAVVSLGVLAPPATARAESPYYIQAIYRGAEGDDPIKLRLTPGQLIADRGDARRLDKIQIRFAPSDKGTTTLNVFSNFSVAVFRVKNSATGAEDKLENQVSVSVADALNEKEQDLFEWDDGMNASRRQLDFRVNVHAKFTSDYLCSQELLYRLQKGEPRPNDDPWLKELMTSRPPPRTKVSPQKCELKNVPDCMEEKLRQELLAKLPKRIVDPDTKDEIAYSYCRSRSDVKEPDDVKEPYLEKIDWSNDMWKYFGAGGASTPTADQKRKSHKRRLTKLLIDQFIRPFASNSKDLVRFSVDDPDNSGDGGGSNVFIEEDLYFSVIRTGGLFTIRERPLSGESIDAQGLVDQVSKIEVTVASTDGGTCADVGGAPFKFYLQDEDPKKNDKEKISTQEINVGYRDSCRKTLDVDLRKQLDHRVRLKIAFQLDKKTELVVAQTDWLLVANLGLITTAPVVTEVVAALTKPSMRDIEAFSSIPISYAIPISRGASSTIAAITFPWKVSYNFRAAPDFAKYFAVFAHLTVLAETKDAGSIDLAFGVGVALTQLLHVAWGVRPGDTAKMRPEAEHYLLVGLSIPDIVKAVFSR